MCKADGGKHYVDLYIIIHGCMTKGRDGVVWGGKYPWGVSSYSTLRCCADATHISCMLNISIDPIVRVLSPKFCNVPWWLIKPGINLNRVTRAHVEGSSASAVR